jgi:hypothetical protein
VRDDQVHRYSRHLMLPDIGGLGQTAIMVASAHLVFRDADPDAELVAGKYLAAGGVGTLVVSHATDAQRAELAAHGSDTNVAAEGSGTSVSLAPRPAWWPAAAGDATALAFWRGSIAAVAWMASVVNR